MRVRRTWRFDLLVRGAGDFVEQSPDSEGALRSNVLDVSLRILKEQNPVGGSAYRVVMR